MVGADYRAVARSQESDGDGMTRNQRTWLAGLILGEAIATRNAGEWIGAIAAVLAMVCFLAFIYTEAA